LRALALASTANVADSVMDAMRAEIRLMGVILPYPAGMARPDLCRSSVGWPNPSFT